MVNNMHARYNYATSCACMHAVMGDIIYAVIGVGKISLSLTKLYVSLIPNILMRTFVVNNK